MYDISCLQGTAPLKPTDEGGSRDEQAPSSSQFQRSPTMTRTEDVSPRANGQAANGIGPRQEYAKPQGIILGPNLSPLILSIEKIL